MSIDVGLKLKYQDLQRALEMAEQLDALLANLSKGYNIKLNQSGIRGAQSQLSALEQSAKRVESAFSTMSKTLSMAGRGLQGLGNAFGGKVVNTMKTMATAFGTMGLYSAAQGTVQRYDTMRMFPRQMALLGFNADQSAKAVDKLEQSVIGLPTGLDEIVESARQLVTLTGDLEKGSNLAIAANNALLAGGGDAQQRTWGQRQIRDLLSAGRLRSQEWESLIKALGPGLKDIGEAMGYADYGKFRTELKANKVAAEDFLDALVRVGTGEGVLAQRADLYKDTLSATAKNIKNSIQKLGAAGLDKLGEVMKEKTGKDFPQTIVAISDAIKQKLVPALEGWISANGDKIVAFFDKLKNYDWIGLVTKVGKGLAQYYNIIVGFFTKVPSGVIAFLSVWAGPIGRLLQTASVVVNGVGGIVGRLIRIFGKGGGAAIDAASAGVSRFANFAGSLKNAFAGLGLAAGFTAEVALIGGVIYEYAKIISTISNMKFGPNLSENMKIIGEIGGYSTAIAGGLTALFSSLASIPGVGLAVAGGEALTGGFLLLVNQIGDIIKSYAKTINYIADMKIPSESKMNNIGKTITSLNKNVLGKVKKVADNKVTYLARLTEMTDYVADIASSLKKVQQVGDIGDMSGYIKTIGKAVKSIMDFDYDRSDMRLAKVESKTLKSVSSAVNSISSIASKLVGMQENIKKLTNLDRTVSIGGEIQRVLTSLISPLSKFQFNTGEYPKAAENLKVISEAVTSIGAIATTLVGAQGNIKKLINLDRTVSIGGEIQRVMYSLATALSSFQWKTDEYNRATQNMERFSKSTQSISEIMGSLVAVKENMNSIGLSDREDGMIVRITTILNRVRSLMDIIDGMEINADGGAKDKMSALAGMVKELPAMVTSLAEAKTQIDALGVGADGTWDLGAKLKTIMNDLNAAFGVQEGQPNLLGEGGSLSGAADNISAIATALETIGANGEAAGKGLTAAQKGMAALKKAADDSRKSVDNAASSLGKLKSAVSGIAGKASLAAFGIGILGTSAKNSYASISNAASAAARLADAVNSIPTNKTVNVSTNINGSKSTQVGNAGDFHRLATGGSVHGPGGIDNVPAWLTAGEFVMRKAAVNRFGAGFMSRINNMDIDGAIKALSIRAGAGVFSKGGVVTNNYSRDNHANVTFNIGRASQGYSQRRANRWARALS